MIYSERRRDPVAHRCLRPERRQPPTTTTSRRGVQRCRHHRHPAKPRATIRKSQRPQAGRTIRDSRHRPLPPVTAAKRSKCQHPARQSLHQHHCPVGGKEVGQPPLPARTGKHETHLPQKCPRRSRSSPAATSAPRRKSTRSDSSNAFRAAGGLHRQPHAANSPSRSAISVCLGHPRHTRRRLKRRAGIRQPEAISELKTDVPIQTRRHSLHHHHAQRFEHGPQRPPTPKASANSRPTW